jgi:serine/threonine protein kinase
MGRGQPERDLTGRSLGSYRVLEALGSGGMGDVYLAEDARLGRRVALKVLPPEVAEEPEKIQRFEREARAIASLSHPGIVVLHSIEEANGLRFLTMEHVEGETLNKAIPPRGFALERFLPLAIALTDAVSAAHRQGILHRDLKPENVMLTAEGRLKVLDFGLAKLCAEGPDGPDETTGRTRSVTQDGWIVGTAAYMSPEQAQGLSVDHRSDIFSLGILLYEMATGERPFKGNTNLSVLSSILKDTPRPVSELRGDIPRPLARMIQRALEKRPEDRYQSTLDLRRDLEDLKRDVDTGELRLVSTGGRRTATGARTRRRRINPDRQQAALGRPCLAPVLAHTLEAADPGLTLQPDPLVGPLSPGRTTVVAFVTDGPGLRDILDHLGILRSADQLAPALPARPGLSACARWGES